MAGFDLKDRVAIVTGGGTGVGKGIVMELAKAGANIVIAARRLQVIEKAAEEVRAIGREALAVRCDITDKDQVDTLVKKTMDKFGKIDILVNNAGGSMVWPFEKISSHGWDVILALNLKGAFHCAQAVGEVMKKQNGGKIINIASVTGEDGSVSAVHYGAAKAGLINMTRSLAMLWGKHNIYVNCIAPGLVKTQGLEDSMSPINTEDEYFKRQIPNLPISRLGTPEEIGGPVVFFASDASNFITGQTLKVDGGMTLVYVH